MASTFNNMKESMLGATANVRGMLNLTTIVVALVMSILVADTHRKCLNNNQDDFRKKSSMALSLSVVVMILCLLLIVYDLYIMYVKNSTPVMPGMNAFGK